MSEITPPATDASGAWTGAFRALGPVFFYFFIGGIATVMLGPLLPALIARWQIQDAQAGTLFTATFVGQTCGAWFATRNLRASVLYGAGLTAIGCALMAWANFGMAHIALCLVGFGLGAGLTAGNIIVGTAIPTSRTRLIAMLNVAWGVGAIACSLLVRACGPGRVQLFFWLLSACLTLAAAFAVALPRAARVATTAEILNARETKRELPLPLVPLLLFAVAMLLFIGIENALGGWLPTYGVRASSTLLASSIALYFWVAEMTGRMLLAGLTSLMGETTLYCGSVALLIVTEASLILVKHPGTAEVVALTILSGLALAPIYPLILSFFLARTGNHPRLGPVFAVASVGGAILPWLTGAISTQFHGLRAGLMVPALGAVLLLLLSGSITGKSQPRQAQA